jgi:hypothetical protein
VLIPSIYYGQNIARLGVSHELDQHGPDAAKADLIRAAHTLVFSAVRPIAIDINFYLYDK